MGMPIELTGSAGLAVLALPLLVMALIIVLVQRRRPSGESAGRPSTPAAPRPQQAAGGAAAKTTAVVRPSRLADEIARAEATGDEAALARLYLSLARERTVVGEIAVAADLLRRSVRCASAQKIHKTHAQGRLELGDLERMSGDLTSACEHWQIARKVASDLGDAALVQAAEERMQRHGCPTDWVLNEF